MALLKSGSPARSETSAMWVFEPGRTTESDSWKMRKRFCLPVPGRGTHQIMVFGALINTFSILLLRWISERIRGVIGHEIILRHTRENQIKQWRTPRGSGQPESTHRVQINNSITTIHFFFFASSRELRFNRVWWKLYIFVLESLNFSCKISMKTVEEGRLPLNNLVNY